MLKILSRVNQSWHTTGMDTIYNCVDTDWFYAYPHKINYKHNSRGFRDKEWPKDLVNAIWCVGDSFTYGIGSPAEHTWPYLLEVSRNQYTVNISLDGASNNWIARQACTILEKFNPETLVIQWSFIHRREAPVSTVLDPVWEDYYNAIKDSSWPECKQYSDFSKLSLDIQQEIESDTGFENWSDHVDVDSLRRLHYINSTIEQDIQNTQDCINSVINSTVDTQVLHSLIPKELNVEFDFKNQTYLGQVKQVDIARDGYHYDFVTANKFVSQINQALGNNALT